ncbi:biorientation of chromosomes in cell division protein 1-like 1 isoform X2 [Phasianus colchicus]|uniref:biorientation of chromosomes in cell division protein 1-like 1 isoform X2 n=1 Tax=Phasianus colchicus TaxID=9054 RepID=UPI00129D6A99|nr:biorientation of chromosomes in cell division protein 1-like 1 isoform X2 [Phasianus colchicus]
MASNPQPQPPPPPPPPPPPQQQPPLPGAGAGAGSGAAEPELVSMIVSHLKSQGLFDQFRRDCLADVDTKPAYQNLRQRVDNFVCNHLATHTWSPHLNKNQLRNNIRQQVLKSGMLESGIDRIISQVVDPKINHTFRPQVEKAVHEFLATLNHKEEAGPSTAPSEEKTDTSVAVQGVSTTAPSGNVASDAMSILETITSLNQEASAARASTENSSSKNNDRAAKRLLSQQSVDGSTERNMEDLPDKEKAISDLSGEGAETFVKCEDSNELPCQSEEIKNSAKDAGSSSVTIKDTSKEIQQDSEDQKSKLIDKCEKKPEGDRRKEKKEKLDKKKNDDTAKSKEEKQVKESEPVKQLVPEKNSNKHKSSESTKEEHTSLDSDTDVLSDITVSSVHTSDLSSFEEESEEEPVISDSTEEGEITSDDEEEKNNKNRAKPHTNELSDGKAKPVRHAYVRKPFLYSKYFSDSDDERTVEQRRQSIAKEKEERLLRRRMNRERLEEKRKQKTAEKTKSQKSGSQNAKGKSGLNLEEPSARSLESKATGTSIKDVLKEQKFLEKKVALSRKRKRDSRHVEDSWKKKYEPSEDDSKEVQKTNETCEKNSSKELKHNHGKTETSKPLRRLSESVHSAEENKTDSKVEKEHKRKISTSLHTEGIQQDIETKDPKRQLERAEANTDELQKQKTVFKNEKHPKKDSDTEIQHMRNAAKKEAKSYRDKNEKEITALEDKLSLKHKCKGDNIHKSVEDTELHSSEKSLKGEDGAQKHNQQMKISSDDKSERKSKHRSERKISVTGKDGKGISDSTLKAEELLRKENKKDRHLSTEKSRAEYKSKRSLSDSRPQKDSISASKQLASASHKRSESYSEEKHEIKSTNSDCNLKQEDGVHHKDRRRSKSLAEDKILLKSKSKSHSKQLKASETELQENLAKQDTCQKLDKDKNMEENDLDKQHNSKNEDKISEESGADFELESGMQSTQGSQKDSSHRVKLHSGEKGSVKEKCRGDKDLSNSKLERKFSVEGHKSRSIKHSNKEIKKKEECAKVEDKDMKEMDGGNEKVMGITVTVDKKQSKKVSCENRKGSISNHNLLGEETQSVGVTVSSSLPVPQKSNMNSNDVCSGHEGEMMELDLDETKVQKVSIMEGKEILNSVQATAKEKISSASKELKHSLADLEASELKFLAAVEKANKQEDIPHKQVGALDALSKQTSIDQGLHKEGAYKMGVVSGKSHGILLNPPNKDRTSEDSRKPKNFKTVINSNSDNVPLAISSPREDAADPKSVDMEISDFTRSLGGMSSTSKEECHNSDGTSLFEDDAASKNDATQVVYMAQEDSVVLSSIRKSGDDNTKTNKIEKDNDTPRPDEQAMENSAASSPIRDNNKASKLGSTPRSKLKIKEESLRTGVAEDCGDVSTKALLKKLKKKEKECLNTNYSPKGERSTMMDNVQQNETHDTCNVIQSSSMLASKRDPDETVKDSVPATGQEGNSSIKDKNESSAVGTSAGSSKLSLLYSSIQTVPATVIGTSTEKIESTVMASSTGEERAEGASHSEKESDATTTCSEEESEMAFICTSIEADEGFTTGIWVKSGEGSSFITGTDIGECTVTAAEEGGGSVVTEGLAESESFLTSTKEEENDDCTMVDAEESGKDSVNGSGVENEDSVNSAGAEEKDDAVTSAGSEEKRKTLICGGAGKLESSVSCLGEVESDGAVTSAGTESGEGSTSGDSSGEFRGNTRAGQVKEHESTVTCTGAEERGRNFIMCSVTGTDAQGEGSVSGACIAVVTNNNAATGTTSDKCEDTINGESTVTSTGITPEDDAEISVLCTGIEDSNEGFAVCLDTEKCESAMDSTGTKEEASITIVSIGPCDDEGFVTSTGSKEEDEEGEGIVTSTGRGNEEIDHASTCTGTEGENTLICIGAEEGESSIICIVAEQMEAESGLAGTDINKLTVDSMTDVEKEANCGTNCKSAKGIVESSVTSASADDEDAVAACIEKHEGTLIPLDAEDCEGPMTSAMTLQDRGQPGAEEHENAMTFGSGELDVSISSAIPKEDENSLIPADREEKIKGDIISTSTMEGSDAPLHSAIDAEDGPLPIAIANESGESSMISVDAEGTEMPMPSTATEFKESVLAFSSKQDKDECTMISTSIVEEFEAPMSSATIEYNGQLPSVETKEINESTVVSIGTEIYDIPMPSASSAGEDDESHPTASNKEEKDECAMISTSVVEEQIILMSGEVAEETVQHISETESKNETVMISTSTAECFEAPMSSVAVQDENKLTASETEGRYEAAVITTSMTEECEIVLISAAPQAEDQLLVAERDEEDISPNASEECKIVETTATVDEQFGLAAFNTDARGKGSVIFVGECGGPMLRVATNSEDQDAASSIGDKEGAVIALSTMEECDSLFTFTVIEESQLDAESSEVKDKSEEVFNTANQIECILSTAGPEKNGNSLLVIGQENETHESVVRGASTASQMTVDSEIPEADENSVNLMSVDEALCVEISTETAVSPNPSSEVNEDDEQAEDVLHEDVASELSCIISEASVEGETLRDITCNSNVLLESDFSEIRTPLPGERSPSLVSANELTVNNHSEETVETELGEKSDCPVFSVEELYGSDDKTNLVKVDDSGTEVSFQKTNTTFNSGNNGALPKLAEELEFETNLRTEEPPQPESAKSEEVYVDLHVKELQKDSLQKNSAIERQTIHVENLVTQITEELQPSVIECKTSGIMDKEKSSQLIAQDVGTDDDPSQCSRTKPSNIKEITSCDAAKVSEEVVVTHTPPASAVEEKDEFTIEQEMFEKTKQSLESNENSVEDNQPVIVKRKRGRPRKHPVEDVQPGGGGESKADMSTGNLQFPTSASRGKSPQRGTDISNKKETANEDEAGRAEMTVRKRGRKPRRSLAQAEETEMLEPERKRRKLTSSEEEIREQEEGEEEDNEEDDESTTRPATRLEAQRMQSSKPTTRATSKGSSPSSVSPRKQQKLSAKKRSASDTKINKSPPSTQQKVQSAKRKREGSPTAVRRKGQQKTEEIPVKKAKR